MMKVTNFTFNQISANHMEKVTAKAPKLQKLLKNGKWGRPFTVLYTKGDPVAYMEKLNPDQKYRIAE